MAALNSPDAWGLEPSPANCSLIDNNTLIGNNTLIWNGTAIWNGTDVVNCTDLTTQHVLWNSSLPWSGAPALFVGGVPLVSFAYLIMSCIIIVVLARPAFRWLRALPRRAELYAPPLLPLAHGRLTVAEFEERLRAAYPPPPPVPGQGAGVGYTEKVAPWASEAGDGGPTGAQHVRHCRQTIRETYALDVLLQELRTAAPRAGEGDVRDLHARAAAGRAEIASMVDGWMARREQWNDDEWRKIEEIRRRLDALGS